jgi:hypothetical protein
MTKMRTAIVCRRIIVARTWRRHADLRGGKARMWIGEPVRRKHEWSLPFSIQAASPAVPRGCQPCRRSARRPFPEEAVRQERE